MAASFRYRWRHHVVTTWRFRRNPQLGPSGKGRKGTSAAIGDDFLGPALLRLAHEIQARIAFPDEVESARDEAEAAVEEAARKLSWTRSIRDFQDSEIEAGLAMLRQEHAAAAREIAERKARLKAKARAYRTVREQEKLIAAAEAKRADIARLIAEDEAELTEVRRVMADRETALAEAEAAHDAAQAKLDGLPPPAPPPAPWLGLFASLADGPVTATGVSTGEGLIELIRDPGRKQGLHGPIHDPGVDNKCLFLNLDELGSVLAVIMRPGATLSSVLRTMWDCRKTELVNKNSPTRCKEPYVTMSASITPGELMGRLFDRRDAASSADNGLGNRLLYLWVKRDKLKARPLATPGLDAMMDAIADNIFRVYEVLKPAEAFLSTPIDFSPGAYQRYELEYPRIANLKAAGRNAAKLIERLPVYLRKIAAILAVMNGEHEISEGALEAAIAWVEYAAGTVNAIAATAADRKKTRILADDGETILAALKALGGDMKPVSSREVQRKARLDKKPFDAAIVELMQQGPAPISISGGAIHQRAWGATNAGVAGLERCRRDERRDLVLKVSEQSARVSHFTTCAHAGCGRHELAISQLVRMPARTFAGAGDEPVFKRISGFSTKKLSDLNGLIQKAATGGTQLAQLSRLEPQISPHGVRVRVGSGMGPLALLSLIAILFTYIVCNLYKISGLPQLKINTHTRGAMSGVPAVTTVTPTVTLQFRGSVVTSDAGLLVMPLVRRQRRAAPTSCARL